MHPHMSSCASGGARPLFSQKGRRRKAAAFFCFLLLAFGAQARGTYMTVAEFLGVAFSEPPKAQTLWLNGDVQQRLEKIFGHPYKSLRVRYWQQDKRTAWILEEIGKEMPITLGVVVEGDAIEQIRVLVYRESRGGEVRHDFFTRQFEGARLEDDDSLDRRIDGITGATLSVRALTRVAQAALALSEVVGQASQ